MRSFNLEKSQHWADQTAKRVIAIKGNKDLYTVASGITPSGTVHVGNFREVITVVLVAKALMDAGKKVRFIYSWDNFDTFRKVPKDFPNQEMLQKELRRAISRIPDAFGEAPSYAARNIQKFEKELERVGIKPEFLYQEQRYGAGLYAKQIREALEQRGKIMKILDVYRKEPLPENWLPASIYCEKCQRDEMEYETYPGEWNYSYKCKTCGNEATTDIRTTKNLKLNWRADWPMRWGYEGVDFEPGGKDHSSDGGSFDTGKEIIKQVWDKEPPVYLQYDFVMIKGGTGKMSSSKGELFTLSQVLDVYTPEMVRWIFSSQRPNHDFSLAFDIDVIKVYEEFDRAETAAYDFSKSEDPKWIQLRRNLELAAVSELPETKPYRAGFRELCNRLQICGGDFERTLEKFYAKDIKTPVDKQLFLERCEKAWTWIQKYAPDDFKYVLHRTPVTVSLNTNQQSFLKELRSIVNETNLDVVDAKELNQIIYDKAIHGTSCDPKEAFVAVYQKLIGRDQGPRLPSFLKEIGKERILELI